MGRLTNEFVVVIWHTSVGGIMSVWAFMVDDLQPGRGKVEGGEGGLLVKVELFFEPTDLLIYTLDSLMWLWRVIISSTDGSTVSSTVVMCSMNQAFKTLLAS